MSSALAPNAAGNANANANANGNGNGNGNGQPTMPALTPQAQQMLAGMTKERLHGMIARMQQLKATGVNESNSQEYAALVNTLKMFQQFQAMRQQQVAAMQGTYPPLTFFFLLASLHQTDLVALLLPSILARAAASQAPGSAPQAAQVSATSAPSAPTNSAPASTAAVSAPAPTTATPNDAVPATNGAVTQASAPIVTSAPNGNTVESLSSSQAGTPKPDDALARSVSPAAFTPDQLNALQTQIIAFKLISRNQPLPPNIQDAILSADRASEAGSSKGSPKDAEPLASATKVAAAAVASNEGAQATKDAKQAGQNEAGPSAKPPAKSAADIAKQIGRPASPKDDPASSIYPYNAYLHPFSYVSKPLLQDNDYTATKQQRLLIPSIMPTGLEPRLLLEERDRFVQARIRQRILELESLPAHLSQHPTLASLKGKENERDTQQRLLGAGLDGDNAKIKALIELKSLHLLEKQKLLREQVVRGLNLATTLGLDRVAFRRVKKQTLRDARMTEQLERKQRVDREKRARQKHTDYLNTICNHGRDLVAAHAKANDQARRLGRAMLKFHADTEREEQKRIERIAKERLNALKADDEEAYLKLIDTAKDTRITHLLKQTDAYLDSLAQAVQAQQNDDVHAEAIAAERAGLPPPEADGTGANQEIGIAVDETMFGASRQDDPSEDKGKVDYYSVAHRITERISEQPTILVGGKLKEYQIKGLQWMVSLYNNRLNGILADEMGLGKTIQTISLITFLIEHKRQNGPYLVIVPLSTLTNWVNEFGKWAPSVSTLIYKGTPNVRKQLAGRLKKSGYGDYLLGLLEQGS